jgi:hypothetical protein
LTLKDQSGSQAAADWLREKGRARYNPRESRLTLAQRVTEPIKFDHWQLVVDMGRCLACGGMLLHKRNTRTGGDFNICEHQDCGWYISYRVCDAQGVQVKLEQKAA